MELRITMECFGTEHKREIMKALEKAQYKPKQVTFVNSPGLSGNNTETVKIRSRKISPCCTTEDIVII